MENCCPILELRQYNLVPGKREDLIQVFDNYFIESQEGTGMVIVGQFRDINQPDHFVWVRGFRDMDSREKALNKFYFESPAWKEHSKEANPTMVDVNNVLLLKPARPDSGFHLAAMTRPAMDSTANSGRFALATIYHFDKGFSTSEFIRVFQERLVPAIEQTGGVVLSCLVTDSSKNNFPALPVREDANVFIWWTSFTNKEAYDAYRKSAESIRVGGSPVSQFLNDQGVRSIELLELTPTSRSLLR